LEDEDERVPLDGNEFSVDLNGDEDKLKSESAGKDAGHDLLDGKEAKPVEEGMLLVGESGDEE
tara:strand:+ start:1765 stop:1953 length:189 start_codon:yes stop_codon:yes gene_type:complete